MNSQHYFVIEDNMHSHFRPLNYSLVCTVLLSLFLCLSISTVVQAKTKHTNTHEELEASNKAAEEQRLENIEKIGQLQSALDALRLEIKKSSTESANLTDNKIKTIKEGFNAVEKKIQQIFDTLENDKALINNNKDGLQINKKELAAIFRETRANITDIGSQKSLIEDNSIRLYELLVKVDAISETLRHTSRNASTVKNETTTPAHGLSPTIKNDLDRLWMLLSIMLVSLSPLAFVFSSNKNQFPALKDGTPHHQGIILVCIGAFLSFVLVGFGFMYGSTASGWIGLSSYILEGSVALSNLGSKIPFIDFLLYQAGFIMFAALIVYTAIGKQLSAASHLLVAIFVGALLIPIFGHWAWSEQFLAANRGWLESLGFIDHSGATVINIVAAWFAFMIIWKLGTSNNPDDHQKTHSNYPVYSAAATLFLWLSWQGFSTGTQPISDSQIPLIILNSGLAATAGGMMAFLHSLFFYADKGQIGRGISGFIAGLVAIAACAPSVTVLEAIAIGVSAGIIQNIAFTYLSKHFLKADSQIPAAYIVSIHGVGGIWGTLCVALLRTEGTFSAPNTIQLFIQIQGIAAALVYSLVMGHIAYLIIKLRMNGQEKREQAKKKQQEEAKKEQQDEEIIAKANKLLYQDNKR